MQQQYYQQQQPSLPQPQYSIFFLNKDKIVEQFYRVLNPKVNGQISNVQIRYYVELFIFIILINAIRIARNRLYNRIHTNTLIKPERVTMDDVFMGFTYDQNLKDYSRSGVNVFHG
jgi:hypothetical protein